MIHGPNWLGAGNLGILGDASCRTENQGKAQT
jgi:hypothetical protein